MAKKRKTNGFCSSVCSVIKGAVLLISGLVLLANLHWHFGTIDNQFHQHLPPQPSPQHHLGEAPPKHIIETESLRKGVGIVDTLKDNNNHPTVVKINSDIVFIREALEGAPETMTEQGKLHREVENSAPPPEEIVPFEPPSQAKKQQPIVDLEGITLHLTPPIIVGGTDGSGTRGVVALLLSSGVLMLSDEGGDGGCQYDVHGKELHKQGWPPVVQRVLRETNCANYTLPQLTASTREDTLKAVQTMAESFRKRVMRGKEKGSRRWGFKAPVSMYMIPFWAKVFPKATFIHVVRDGRDMSFHWLQSPIKRYWPHLFPHTMASLSPKERRENALVPDHGSYVGKAYIYDVPKLNKAPHFRIAELWAESNLQVQDIGNKLSSTEFGFLTVRSEDFVSEKPQFLQASGSLLEHARPDMSHQELCCIALVHWQQEHQSVGWSKNIQNYGKWRGAIDKYGGMTSDSSSLYGGIMHRARRGLEYFGYLSGHDWTYDFGGDVSRNVCSDISVDSCPNRAHIQKCL